MFLHVFWNIRRKKSEWSFFQKISPKSKIPFFSKIFSRIFQISRKLLNIFSSLFLVPLEDILRHLFKKISKKKSNFIFVKKFRNFFFLRKNFGRKKFTKDFLYKIFIKGFPLYIGKKYCSKKMYKGFPL